MGVERYSILYATVCKRHQLVDKKVEACVESLPYSDRAMNIMKAERRKQSKSLKIFPRKNPEVLLKSERVY